MATPPPDYDPNEDRGNLRIDTSILTAAEKELLLAALRRGLVREEGAEPVAPVEIDGQAEQ